MAFGLANQAQVKNDRSKNMALTGDSFSLCYDIESNEFTEFLDKSKGDYFC